MTLPVLYALKVAEKWADVDKARVTAASQLTSVMSWGGTDGSLKVSRWKKKDEKEQQPDVEWSLLIGSQGSRARAHAVVHHLLPQVVNFGLKTSIFYRRHRAIVTDGQGCGHGPSHPRKRGGGRPTVQLTFNMILLTKGKRRGQRKEACLGQTCILGCF